MADGQMVGADLADLMFAGTSLPKDIVSLQDFTRRMVEHCIAVASAIEAAPPAACAEIAKDKCMGVMFYQQSTRTRMSFEAAMLKLGGHVVGFADPATTRAVGFYEESLDDVVRFTAAISDILVLRHTETGAARRAAEVSPVSLINAGDGYGEHPTQSLGDIYHIHKHFGCIDGLTIGIIGHLGWRAHRSLVIGLSLFGVRLAVLEPPGSAMPPDVEQLLAARGISVDLCVHIDELLQKSDIVTTLGVYHSNFHANFDDKLNISARQERPTPETHRITAKAIAGLGRFVPVLHIGPISDHIDRDIDRMPQAHYFKQARDGVWMRAALLGMLCRQSTRRGF